MGNISENFANDSRKYIIRLNEDINMFFVILYMAYFVLGAIGNGVLIILFLRHKKLRDINNAFVTNLALSDFLFVILVIPIKIHQQYFNARPFGAAFCAVSVIINFTSQDVSTFSLASMTYFRYRAVVRPLQSRSHIRDKKQSRLIAISCVICWGTGIIVSIYPATRCYGIIINGHMFRQIHFLQNVDDGGYYRFITFRTVVCFVIPLVINACFSGMMAVSLFKGSVALQRNCCPSARRALRSRVRLGGIVLAIASLFFVSWFPLYFYMHVIRLKKLTDETTRFLFLLSEICMFLPSSLNPLILFATSTGYRTFLQGVCSHSWRLRSTRTTCSPT